MTEPVTATGDVDGDRVHLVCCSWSCLAEEIRVEDFARLEH